MIYFFKIYVYYKRDLSLKVKLVPFKHYYMGSNPIDLKCIIYLFLYLSFILK